MSSELSRRAFLGSTVTVGAAALVVPQLASRSPSSAPTPNSTRVGDDPLATLCALSQDATGRAHIAQAAFITDGHASGDLAVTAAELATLTCALAADDFAEIQRDGLRLAGAHFTLIRYDVDGDAQVVHAVRAGGFVTARAKPGHLVIATSAPDMAHGRAVEAVYQFMARVAPAPAC